MDEPVKLFAAILTVSPSLVDELRPKLEKKWGKVHSESALLPVEIRLRKFFVFRKLVEPEALVEAKRWTQSLEEDAAREGKFDVERPLDLDPGYFTLGKVVRASSKDLSHRIAVGRGVFAEVLYRFRSSVYAAMEWTPAEYRTREYVDFFLQARRALADQVANKELH